MVTTLVVTPTWRGKRYCMNEWAAGIERLLARGNEQHPVDAFIVDNSTGDHDFWKELGERFEKHGNVVVARAELNPDDGVRAKLATSYNLCRQMVLDGSYDYMLTVEADVECDGSELEKLRDALEDCNEEDPNLCRHSALAAGLVPYDDKNTMVSERLAVSGPELGKMNLTAPFLTGGRMGTIEKSVTVCTKYGWSADRRYIPMSKFDEALKSLDPVLVVQGVSLGCTLITRETLEKVEFRYVHESSDFSDIWFCADVRRIFGDRSIVVHAGVRPTHHWRSKEWKEVGKR